MPLRALSAPGPPWFPPEHGRRTAHQRLEGREPGRPSRKRGRHGDLHRAGPGPRDRGERLQGTGRQGPARNAGGLCRHRSGEGRFPLRHGRVPQRGGVRPFPRGRDRGGIGRIRDGPWAPKEGKRRADRGPPSGRPGSHRAGGEGPHRREGRPRDVPRLPAGADARLHADRRPRRRLPADRGRTGAEAPAGPRAGPSRAGKRVHRADGRRGRDR